MWITRLWEDYQARREARRGLRELRTLDRTETRDILQDPNKNPIDLAEASLQAGDHPRAIRHWHDALLRFPDHAGRSHQALRLAVALRLLDEAEALAKAAQKRAPTDPVYYEIEADAVNWRGETAEALTLWTKICKRWPDRPSAYVRAALCLGQLGREDEAEPFLARAVERFPDIMDCRHAYAHMAERYGQWPEALERWTWLELRFPEFADGVLGAARSLEKLGRDDEAEARLKAAWHRHTANPDVAINLARHTARRGAWEDAAQAWATVRNRWPRRIEAYHGGVEALNALGRHADAATLQASQP